MDFRTALAVPRASWSFGLNDPVLTLGSCFASSIGDRLVTRKFQSLVNPFGTTYHPFAIHQLVRLAANRQPASSDGYVERDKTWYHYDFHSSLCAPSREELSALLNEKLNTAGEFLARTSVVILTYGTAWIHELSSWQRRVANCQKMPSSLFTRKLASPGEIIDDFRSTLQSLRAINPDLRVILTVSPVRHVRDTLPLNQVSKSTLRLACHRLHEGEALVDYFPAYELMVDDLRDYRFYADDLIHPTPFAEEYIWQKFGDAYFNCSTLDFLKLWEPLRQALAHRPLQPQGDAYRAFLKATLKQLERVRSMADVGSEIVSLQEQLMQAETR
jgi:hypothetical protein